MHNYSQFTISISLGKYGIKNAQNIIYNPSFEFLYNEELNPNSLIDDNLIVEDDNNFVFTIEEDIKVKVTRLKDDFEALNSTNNQRSIR